MRGELLIANLGVMNEDLADTKLRAISEVSQRMTNRWESGLGSSKLVVHFDSSLQAHTVIKLLLRLELDFIVDHPTLED